MMRSTMMTNLILVLRTWVVVCERSKSINQYNILHPFQIINRFDFFVHPFTYVSRHYYTWMHNKIDVPKKSKRLIIWNGGSSYDRFARDQWYFANLTTFDKSCTSTFFHPFTLLGETSCLVFEYFYSIVGKYHVSGVSVRACCGRLHCTVLF